MRVKRPANSVHSYNLFFRPTTPPVSMAIDSFLHEGDHAINGLGAESWMQLPPGAALNYGGSETWIVCSEREVPTHYGTSAPSSTGGTGNAKASGAGKRKGRRMFSYLSQCSGCGGKAEKANLRKRLCPKDDSCKRWVQSKEFKYCTSTGT